MSQLLHAPAWPASAKHAETVLFITLTGLYVWLVLIA